MQQHGIRAKTQRKFVVTTGSRRCLAMSRGLVQHRFRPEELNRLWCGDITLFLGAVAGSSCRTRRDMTMENEACAIAREQQVLISNEVLSMATS